MNSSTPSYDGRSAGSKQRERLIAVIVFMGITVFMVMQWIVPEMTANRIANQFKTQWKMDAEPEVRVSAFPFFSIWQGQIERIEIQGGNTSFSDIQVDEWQLDLHDVSVDSDPANDGGFSFETGTGYARITENALQQYIRTHSGNISSPRVVIFDEYIFYGGQWESGIIDISFSTRGYPYVHESGEIRLNIESITIGPFDIPGMIREITESFIIELIPDNRPTVFAGMAVTEIMLQEGFIQIDFSTD